MFDASIFDLFLASGGWRRDRRFIVELFFFFFFFFFFFSSFGSECWVTGFLCLEMYLAVGPTVGPCLRRIWHTCCRCAWADLFRTCPRWDGWVSGWVSGWVGGWVGGWKENLQWAAPQPLHFQAWPFPQGQAAILFRKGVEWGSEENGGRAKGRAKRRRRNKNKNKNWNKNKNKMVCDNFGALQLARFLTCCLVLFQRISHETPPFDFMVWTCAIQTFMAQTNDWGTRNVKKGGVSFWLNFFSLFVFLCLSFLKRVILQMRKERERELFNREGRSKERERQRQRGGERKFSKRTLKYLLLRGVCLIWIGFIKARGLGGGWWKGFGWWCHNSIAPQILRITQIPLSFFFFFWWLQGIL